MSPFKISSKDDYRLFRLEHIDFTNTALDILQSDESFEDVDNADTVENPSDNNEGSPTPSIEVSPRSSRPIRAHSLHKDYDMSNNCSTLHLIQNNVCY